MTRSRSGADRLSVSLASRIQVTRSARIGTWMYSSQYVRALTVSSNGSNRSSGGVLSASHGIFSHSSITMIGPLLDDDSKALAIRPGAAPRHEGSSPDRAWAPANVVPAIISILVANAAASARAWWVLPAPGGPTSSSGTTLRGLPARAETVAPRRIRLVTARMFGVCASRTSRRSTNTSSPITCCLNNASGSSR